MFRQLREVYLFFVDFLVRFRLFSNFIQKIGDKYEETKIKSTCRTLDEISSSMCFAKWMQCTIHLGNGLTHSCHHPKAHSIDQTSVEHNFRALHNTNYKKKMQYLMLKGERPKECQYCWDVENSKSGISDRIFKSNQLWAKAGEHQIKRNVITKKIIDVDPTYLEISFSSLCNLKCIYCWPHISSALYKDLESNGPFAVSNPITLEYLTKDKLKPIDENNPYIKAFWNWFPELSKKLHVFRITGGEPLLDQNTFKVFDYLENNPSKKMELSINSNLSVSQGLIDKTIQRVNGLLEKKAIKDFRLFASIDTHGQQAEYIRQGVDYQSFWKNIDVLLNEKIKITIMCTFNILSIDSFIPFLEDFLKRREQFTSFKGRESIELDISLLKNPIYLSLDILPKIYHSKIHEILHFMQSLEKSYGVRGRGFLFYEIEKFKRIIKQLDDLNDQISVEKLIKHRGDFLRFINDLDGRWGLSGSKTFQGLMQAMEKE